MYANYVYAINNIKRIQEYNYYTAERQCKNTINCNAL